MKTLKILFRGKYYAHWAHDCIVIGTWDGLWGNFQAVSRIAAGGGRGDCRGRNHTGLAVHAQPWLKGYVMLDHNELFADPSVSNWLKEALHTALVRDPVDALSDAELLCGVLQHQLDTIQQQALRDANLEKSAPLKLLLT